MLTEVGPDLKAFASEKDFCSWLGVCPDNRISGGKVLSTRTRRVVNRLADALRIAASTRWSEARAPWAPFTVG